MANGNSGVFVQKHKRKRFAHHAASSKRTDVFPAQRNAVALQQLYGSRRRAGAKSLGIVVKTDDISVALTIEVLVRRQKIDDALLVDMFRQRHLNQNAVYGCVVVEFRKLSFPKLPALRHNQAGTILTFIPIETHFFSFAFTY